MNRTRRTFIVIMAATAAGVALLVSTSNRNLLEIGDTNVAGLLGNEPVHVVIASSITKNKWLEAAALEFEAQSAKTKSGKTIDIDVTGVLSGTSMQQLLDGKLQPTVWSPGEESWVAQFNGRWRVKNNQPAMTKPCAPTIYTPSGLAMWRPMAEALGWPSKAVGWKTVIELAADPQGWARYGHPEWGKLKLGYTHPKYSNAGLLFLTSVIYGITGQTHDLKAEQVYEPRVEQALRAIAQHTSKYGMVTTDLFNMMARHGPDFLHAVSAFEEGTVRENLEHGSELRWPLVFLFPSEGTFWSNHPYCILDGLDGASEDQAEAARQFLEFLLAPEQQKLAVQHLLRPLDAIVPTGTLLTAENGTDPKVRSGQVPGFQSPDAAASAAIIDQFLATKRKATIMLVLDISGSMNGEAVRTATDATAAFLSRLDPRDEVGLIAFNDKISVISEIQPASAVVEQLSQHVRQLVAGGGTNLHGAVCGATNMMREIRQTRSQAGENRLYGIIVLSDGTDTDGSISENRMFQTCLPTGPEADGTKVFTIAFGSNANLEVLKRIAQASGATTFEADVESIEQTYLKISAEQ